MSFSSDSKEQISLKKLLGKAHTKNESEFFNESKSSGITVNANTVFAEDIPTSPGSGSQNQITSDIVEYIRLELTPLSESIQDGKYHAFSAALPSTYQSSSGNSKAGDGNFNNSTSIHSTQGKVQLVSDSAGLDYEVKVYNGGTDSGINSGSRIPILDNRRWYFDYFNGVLFQQNPKFSSSAQSVTTNLTSGNSYQIKTKGNTTDEQWRSLGIPLSVTPEVGVSFIAASSLPGDVSGFGTGEVYPAENPEYVEAFLYIGKMASERFAEGNSGGNGSNGSDGEDGADFTFKGPVGTKALLLNVQNPEKGDAYFVDVDESQSNLENVIYVYDGTSFISGGSLKGDAGVQGTPGNDGAAGQDGAAGAPGNDGVDGTDGTDGTDGVDAPTITSVSVSGTTVTTTLDDGTDVSGSISLSIDDLSDVNLSNVTATEGQVLKWDSSTTKFIRGDDTGKTEEEIQDIVGAMVDGGTETDITVSYDDANGRLGFVVDATIARLANPDFTGTPTVPNISDLSTSNTQIANTAFVHALIDSDIAALSLSNTYQPKDDTLTALALLEVSANKLIYATGNDAFAITDLTAFARTILDDNDAETARGTLGLGDIATSSTSDFIASDSGLNSLTDVALGVVNQGQASQDGIELSNAHILVYDDDNGENDNKFKNVPVSGVISIDNSGETSFTVDAIDDNNIATVIKDGIISNTYLTTPFIYIEDESNTDRINLGEKITFTGTTDEIEVSTSSDASGSNAGATITIGLPDNVTIGNNLTVTGDFIVNGTTTSINTTNLDVEDTIISLNNGVSGNNTNDIGLFLNRGSASAAVLFWDEGDDVFKIGTHSSATSSSTDLGGEDFTRELLEIKTPDSTSNDNTATTTGWVTSKLSNIDINSLTDVDTTGKTEGKVLKFNSSGNLVVADSGTFEADTSSLWAEGDVQNPNDPVENQVKELYPHGIIDGTLDTGMFAIDLSAGSVDLSGPDTTLYDIVNAIQNMNAYTLTSRDKSGINDTYWEVDPNNSESIMPK